MNLQTEHNIDRVVAFLPEFIKSVLPKIKIDFKIPFLNKDLNLGIGNLVVKFSKIVKKFSPDIVIIFGDRVELVPISIASSYNGTAIAHIQAGDKSGHIDDMTRMMLSKIVHIHLPSTKISANRLHKLGEQNFRIFNVRSSRR